MKTLTQNEIDEILARAAKRKEEILNTPSCYPETGTHYYVDSENGCDENDGLSPETAWRSMPKVDCADLKAGDVVLFRRGCTFRGTMRSVAGVTYSAYGEGKKPELVGSIPASDPNLWVPTRWKNVWMYANIISYVRDIGAVIFGDGECWGIKVAKNYKSGERCDMYRSNGRRGEGVPHGDLDVWNGRKMVHRECIPWTGPECLQGDLEFYHDWSAERLYLYCEGGNPAKQFSSVELSVRYFIFRNRNDNVTVDNISFKYAGIHAISSGTCKNFTVRNCEFAWIGGSGMSIEDHVRKEPKISYGDDLTRLGNAIEIYGNCDGYTVENNYIRQIYDTGITVQLNVKNMTADHITQNVVWRNNLIDTCHWSLELWLYSPEETNGFTAAYRNIDISNNMVLNNGFGWGTQRPDLGDSFFYGGYYGSSNAEFTNYNIHDNVFFNSRANVFTTLSIGKNGIGFYNNKMYTDSSIGAGGADFEFAKKPFTGYPANDETLAKLEESGCWGKGNEFAKLGKTGNTRIPFKF